MSLQLLDISHEKMKNWSMRTNIWILLELQRATQFQASSIIFVISDLLTCGKAIWIVNKVSSLTTKV
jgi:hypothetical protein